MAKIGLKHFRYGILTEASDGTATYGASTKPGKAISCSVSITNNNAELYADDSLAESDNSFQSGTVTMGIDENDLATKAAMLGHTISNGELLANKNDVAPYVGLGRVITKQIDNVKKYKVVFLHKVKFAEPSDDDATKAASTAFGTYTIDGSVHTLKNGDWKKEKQFDTEEAAIAYLDGLFGTTYIIEHFAAEDSEVTLTHTPSQIISVIAGGALVDESSYSVSNKTITFSPTIADDTAVFVAYTYDT